MFKRNGIKHLQAWAAKTVHKPMIVRGARQVGKTTIVHEFAKEFDQFLYVNLESPADREPFTRFTDVDLLLQEVFFLNNSQLNHPGRSLLFIDEIQEVPEAVNILRYLHEQHPELYVVAAGSLLESLFDRAHPFPVGRVEYMVVRPASFDEFLAALGETSALEQYHHVPVAPFAHAKLRQLYHLYALVGGMPEVVANYAEQRDLVSLKSIYESLLLGYLDDVEKYAASESQAAVIRHAIRASFLQAGGRITFQGFGESAYSSREIGDVLRLLVKAFLLHLVYPTTGTKLPLLPNLRKSPRLQVLDTGLMNFLSGYQADLLGTDDLTPMYQGKVIEHITGQSILANYATQLDQLHFWVREKKSSMAEVDFIMPHKGKVVPIEVKSGAAGKMRSLHRFMAEAPHNRAIRLYAGSMTLEQARTPEGKQFHLLSLPYYLSGKLEAYMDWLDTEISRQTE